MAHNAIYHLGIARMRLLGKGFDGAEALAKKD